MNNEWYTFKYMTNNFSINRSFKKREEEKGRKFIFYEYISEKLKNTIDNRDFELAKSL